MKHMLFALSMIALITRAAVIEIKGQADLDTKLKQHSNAVIKFYRPGCPHCVTISGDYARVSNNIPGTIFLAINTAEQANKSIFPQWGIKGVPALFFVKNGVRTEYKRGRDFTKQFEEAVKKHFA
jgi:thiol-disulfide isomerase/thioredoxin